jgi:hypothetical protein
VLRAHSFRTNYGTCIQVKVAQATRAEMEECLLQLPSYVTSDAACGFPNTFRVGAIQVFAQPDMCMQYFHEGYMHVLCNRG